MRILVTGGAGYIGSHTLLELLGEDHEVLVLDNYSNSSPESLKRVAQLTNGSFDQVEADIRDAHALHTILGDFKPETVVHFAGLKAVGESNTLPLKYYEHNIQGTISLLQAMEKCGCRRIVFSSCRMFRR